MIKTCRILIILLMLLGITGLFVYDFVFSPSPDSDAFDLPSYMQVIQDERPAIAYVCAAISVLACIGWYFVTLREPGNISSAKEDILSDIQQDTVPLNEDREPNEETLLIVENTGPQDTVHLDGIVESPERTVLLAEDNGTVILPSGKEREEK